MFKYTVLFTFVVWSLAANASPPAPSGQRPSSCSRGHSCENGLEPTTAASTGCGHDSGYKYSNKTGRCYKYHGERMSWTLARDACVAEGGDLAVINGRGEARVLGDMAEEGGGWTVHVGYHRDDDGVWRTLTGESPETAAGYSPWCPGWPLNWLPEWRYSMMWIDGALYNENNVVVEPFICEKEPQ